MRPSSPVLLAALAAVACDPTPPEPLEVAPPSAAEARQPSFLVITLDTTRADALTPYGAPDGLTPTASRLAREGFRFTRAYTVTPLTIPAHSTLHTGLWPTRHGVRDNGDHFLADGAVTLAEQLKDAGYSTMASVGAEVTSRHWGFAQGFDAYFDDMGEAADTERSRWRVERPGKEVVDDASKWLAERSTEAPFFAWVHLFDAHHPYAPVEPGLSPGNPYFAEVGHADRQIGRLVDQLEASGQLDHTWIFMLADHGEGLGSHGEAAHGVLLYDDTTWIPFLVRPPSGSGGHTMDFPTTIADVAPTVLGLAGLPMPEAVDGANLAPWLRDPTTDAKVLYTRAVYMESLYGWLHYGWAPQRAIVDPRYKLIDSTRPELYASDDRGERSNIAATHEPVVDALRSHVDKMAERMTPVVDATGDTQLDPAQAAQLEALGYMTGGTVDTTHVPFRGDLEDPVSRMPVLRRTEDIRMALQADDLPRARALAEALLEREPGFDQVRSQLVTILQQMGEADAALALVEEMDRQQPSSSSRFALARAHLARRDVDGALVLLQEAIDRDPFRAEIWTVYLQTLFASKQPDRFRSELDRAATHLDGHALIEGFRGVAALADGDPSTAEPLLESAHARSSELPMVRHALATIRIQQGRLTEAEELLKSELAHHPGAVPAEQALIAVYGQQSRWTDQLQVIERLATRLPAEPRLVTTHAHALLRLDRPEEALAVTRVCEGMQPVFPDCVGMAAEALAALGRMDEADAAAKRAAELRASR